MARETHARAASEANLLRLLGLGPHRGRRVRVRDEGIPEDVELVVVRRMLVVAVPVRLGKRARVSHCSASNDRRLSPSISPVVGGLVVAGHVGLQFASGLLLDGRRDLLSLLELVRGILVSLRHQQESFHELQQPQYYLVR